jgi:hypothetical protein
MEPDVAAAVDRLAAAGTLSPAQQRLFGRVARDELVSVRADLRLLLYVGVLVFMSGVGVLVQENLEHIGPLAIVSALTVATAGCLLWVYHRAAPFTWEEARDPHLGLDFLLLLGILLLGADLACIETWFVGLGGDWPWHLLLLSILTGLLAVRFDSSLVFSVALSTFAAWRGVSVSVLGHTVWWWQSRPGALRLNAMACGTVFLLLGALLERTHRKAHFEPVAVYSGWILVLVAVFSGLDTDPESPSGLAFTLLLLALGAALAAWAFQDRRFALFAIGVLAAYAGLSALAFRAVRWTGVPFGSFPIYWFFATPIAMLWLLFLAHRHMKEKE